MEAGWNAQSSFCTSDTAHAVVTWLLEKDADVRFVAKVWDPTRKKATFTTEWSSMSAGTHVTCLVCEFEFQDQFTTPGLYKMRVKVQAKRAGSAGDLYRFDVDSCAAAAGLEAPATPHH
jgi:hypothetical protein